MRTNVNKGKGGGFIFHKPATVLNCKDEGSTQLIQELGWS